MGSFDQALTMRLSTAILLIAQASQAWSLNETETTTSATTTTQTTTGYNQPCRIVLPSGEVTTHHKFEASDGTVNITIQDQTGCQLRALLVGGGGGGYCSEGNGVECDAGNYTGGTNGSNGGGPSIPDDQHGAQGHGTGEDISSYRMDKFKLSPGQGGMAYRSDKYGYVYGGGGGGILVDGAGPTTDGYAGQGYGAGGGGRYVTSGLSGVVLIETVE